MTDNDKLLQEGLDSLIQLRDSKGWALLTQKFQVEADNCLREMETVDPDNPAAIRNLQQEIRCYRLLINSLDELIGFAYSEEQLEEDAPIEFMLEDGLEQDTPNG